MSEVTVTTPQIRKAAEQCKFLYVRSGVDSKGKAKKPGLVAVSSVKRTLVVPKKRPGAKERKRAHPNKSGNVIFYLDPKRPLAGIRDDVESALGKELNKDLVLTEEKFVDGEAGNSSKAYSLYLELLKKHGEVVCDGNFGTKLTLDDIYFIDKYKSKASFVADEEEQERNNRLRGQRGATMKPLVITEWLANAKAGGKSALNISKIKIRDGGLYGRPALYVVNTNDKNIDYIQGSTLHTVKINGTDVRIGIPNRTDRKLEKGAISGHDHALEVYSILAASHSSMMSVDELKKQINRSAGGRRGKKTAALHAPGAAHLSKREEEEEGGAAPAVESEEEEVEEVAEQPEEEEEEEREAEVPTKKGRSRGGKVGKK